MPESINISASRGAAILGLSKYETSVDAWLKLMEQREPGFCERKGYKIPIREENPAMEFGHLFEDAIVRLYEKEIVCWIESRESFFSKGKITTHIDGFNPAYKRLYEAKTANIRAWRESWGEPGTDQIPADYMIQVQHQMICTGIDQADIAVLILPEGQDWLAENGKVLEMDSDGVYRIAQALADLGFFKIYHVEKNERLQERMLANYERFWNENVLKEIPPDPQTFEDVKKICPAPSGTIVANEVLEELCSEYNQTNQAMKAANDRKDELKKMIANGMRKLSSEAHQEPESVNKWILLNRNGKQIASMGEKFMVGRGA